MNFYIRFSGITIGNFITKESNKTRDLENGCCTVSSDISCAPVYALVHCCSFVVNFMLSFISFLLSCLVSDLKFYSFMKLHHKMADFPRMRQLGKYTAYRIAYYITKCSYFWANFMTCQQLPDIQFYRIT